MLATFMLISATRKQHMLSKEQDGEQEQVHEKQEEEAKKE
jgi:HD-like signal output (HDOD) protein